MPIKKEIMIEKYIESLEQEQIPWEKGWTSSRPHNPITGTEYTGMNRLWLNMVSYMKGYNDSRWFTFNEILDKNGKYHPNEDWHLKKGSEGVEIANRPTYYNKIEDKYYSSRQYYKKLSTMADDEKEIFKEECKIIWNSSDKVYIYNAQEIEGIAPEEKIEVNEIDMSKMQLIMKNMNVGYQEVLQDKSFYNFKTDMITLPPKERFKNEGAFFATLLHEISHATGHVSRLNRKLSGNMQSSDYAKEELRADIAASFLVADFGLEYDESHLKNHIAYIQNWAQALKNDKSIFLEVVKDAELINDYVKEMSKERAIEISIEMEDCILEGKDKYIEIIMCYDGVSYTVFDKSFYLKNDITEGILDGGTLEIDEKMTLKEFLEAINTDRLKIDTNERYTVMDTKKFYDYVDQKLQIDKIHKDRDILHVHVSKYFENNGIKSLMDYGSDSDDGLNHISSIYEDIMDQMNIDYSNVFTVDRSDGKYLTTVTFKNNDSIDLETKAWNGMKDVASNMDFILNNRINAVSKKYDIDNRNRGRRL